MASTLENGSATKKVPLLSLALVPASTRLTNNLLPDSYTPRPDSLLATRESLPTQIRRSRPVGNGAHFSFVSPLVLEFPYDFPETGSESGSDGEEGPESAAENEGLSEEEKRKKKARRAAERRMEVIEGFMRKYEVDPDSIPETNSSNDASLHGYLPPARKESNFPSARLLGVSEPSVQHCLPNLDIGDSIAFIASNSGKDYGPETYTSGPAAGLTGTDAAARARTQLSDVLAGRLIGSRFPAKDQLTDDAGVAVEVYRRETTKERAQEAKKQEGAQTNGAPNAEESEEDKLRLRLNALSQRSKDSGKFAGYAPWANCYAGHQFGSWAGQLGDGRAITLLEASTPFSAAEENAYGGGVLPMPPRTEVQLKGAGRTPYSRFADGLATLASSVREYLCSEAMAGLGIPTSRALAVLAIRDVTVVRERASVAAVTARLAPSWLRIGSFQIHASRGEWESVRILGEYVARDLLSIEAVGRKPDADIEEDSKVLRKPWALALVNEVARRNAETIARWQVNGFMHGVMNTDNISLLGLTIDYGPYAFMDIFDRHQICNHSDSEGRYTYHRQPSMGAYAINHLVMSLSPLIGFEKDQGRAPYPFELLNADEKQLEQWSVEGAKLAKEVEEVYTGALLAAWKKGWLARLGLEKVKEGDTDQSELIDPLLRVLEDVDFNISLRRLHTFARVALSDADEGAVKEYVKESKFIDLSTLVDWQKEGKVDAAVQWLKVYQQRLKEEGRKAEDVETSIKSHNPSFVLRNWVTDEVVQRLTHKDDTNFLAQVLEMCVNPFEAWDESKSPQGMSQEEATRLCQLGTPLNGNLPSCSS